MVEWKEGWQFKCLAKDWVELVVNVVIVVIDLLLSNNLHLQVQV